MLFRSVSFLALAGGFAGSALAATDDPAEEATDPIVVTGTRQTYTVEQTSTATRTPTDLNDIPQAISVVTERQIQDQSLQSIADLLRYVPGAVTSTGEGHRDQIILRGNSSTADFFVDGLRDDVQYYRGLYNLDRVEVLKGPNAMIFGRGGGGGIVNRVTKRPEPKDFARGAASLDNMGAWAADLDLNRVLAPAVSARLNATYEEFGNHRDVYEGRRIGANPTLAVTPGGSTRIDLGYEYDNDERVVDRGVPSAGIGTLASPARPLTGFRRTFFGDPDVNRSHFQGHVLTGRLEHRFSDALTVNSRILYGDYDKYYRNLYTSGPATAAGKVEVAAYREAVQRQNLLSQTDLVLETRTGPVRHVLLAGVDYSGQQTGAQRHDGFFVNPVAGGPPVLRRSVPLVDPFSAPAPTFALTRSTTSEAEALAAYVQDQISFGEHFDLVAGLRFDRFRLDAVNVLTGQSFRRTDGLWSPRLGLVAKPTEAVSLYASYSRSYLPQSGDQFSSLDVTLAALEPEKFENVELGAKWDIRPALSLTAAVYRLERTNTRANDPSTGQIVLTGAQRSKGVEIGLSGEIRPNWRVSAGYAYTDAEIVRTTAAAPAGRKVALVPRHQASLWTRYDFTPRFGAGLGAYHQSRSFTSISNTVALPAFTRVDAAAYVKITGAIEAQVNVENVLGANYFSSAFNDNNIMPGAPMTVRGTLRFTF
jgi:catecholate siderophore receptor